MRKILIAFAICLTAMGVGSCGDLLETSNNGKLDGNWYLTTIDSLSNGVSVDVTTDRKFLSVQGPLLVVRDIDETPQYMFRFTYTNNQLILSDARLNDREQGDPLLTDPAVLQPFGINSQTDTFTVEFPNTNRLVLTNKILKLTLKRF